MSLQSEIWNAFIARLGTDNRVVALSKGYHKGRKRMPLL